MQQDNSHRRNTHRSFQSNDPFGSETEQQFVFYRQNTLNSNKQQPSLPQLQINQPKAIQPLLKDVSNSSLHISCEQHAEGQEMLDSFLMLTETERKKATLQLQATNLLLEESQHLQKRTMFKFNSIDHGCQKGENYQIQGFYVEEKPQVKKENKNQKFNGNSGKKYGNITNTPNQMEYWNKRRYTSQLKRENRMQVKPSEFEHCEQPYKGIQNSQQVIKAIMYKINNLKSISSDCNEYQALNHRFITLQEKFNRKKPLKVNPYLHSRIRTQPTLLKNCVSSCTSTQPNLISIEIRRLISPSKAIHIKKQGQYPFNQQTHEELIKTKYEHFKPSSLQKKMKQRNSSTELVGKEEKDRDVMMQSSVQMIHNTKSGVDIARQKIGHIFKRLKDLKNKEEKPKSNLKQRCSLHNIHTSQGNRQEAALKFHWNSQRNKLKNNIIKHSTIDISKLSLISSQSQKKGIQELLRTKNIRAESKVVKTEQSQRQCKIISPVFISGIDDF